VKTPPADPKLDMDALFAAERIIPPYRNEIRERAFSRAKLGTPIQLARPSATARWSWRPRQILVAAAVLLVLASVAAAAFEIRQRREQASELSPVAPRVEAQPSPASLKAGARPAEVSLRAEEYQRELRILEPARRAFARGDFAAVIRAADEHQRSFPAGGLAEERDALRVRALFRQNRVAEARRAAAALRKTFPNSAVLGENGK
jgi:hypothetical protein